MPSAPGLGPAGQGGKLVYPKPTSSIAEVEPSLLWSPAVLAGGRVEVVGLTRALRCVEWREGIDLVWHV